MCTRFTVIVSMMFLLSFSTAYTQNAYNFSKINIETGLSHNQVNAIIKDTDGFLWFGTISGLNRYDGYSFKIFRKEVNDSASLYNNSIQALFELPDGKIWVNTGVGPCIYNSYTEKFDSASTYLSSLGLPTTGVTNVIKGKDGKYWFLYDNQGLYVYQGDGQKAKLFKKNFDSGPTKKITSVAETPDGKLWLVYQDGWLQQYDLKSKRVIFSTGALQKLSRGNVAYNLVLDSSGDLWLWYFEVGVFIFRPQDNSVKHFSENSVSSKLNSNLVTKVVEDDNGLIWVATDHGGVNVIDKKNNFKVSYILNDPTDPKSLSQNSINAIYKDDDGIMWLGTYKQGINYLNSKIVTFPHYHYNESNTKSLQYDDVNRFAEDKYGNIWIGTNGGGLIYFDRKNNTFKQYLHDPNNSNSLSNNVIVSLFIDHQEKIWIGTYYGGLNSFDGKKFTHYRHNNSDTSSLADDKVWEIFEDREKNLWVGTLGSGLDRFNRNTNSFEHHKNKPDDPGSLAADYISSILQDRKGNIWVGTNGGISVFEKNTIVRYTKDKNKLTSDNVICLMEDAKGKIWVGTGEGLNVFNEQTKTFQTFTTADGLPDNMILNILEDNHEALWISTPNGLCNAILQKKDIGLGLSVINYSEINNLQNREFNDNAALKTRSGELIFGGPSGFNIINPDKIEKPVYNPKIIFTGLQILNTLVEPGKEINGRILLKEALSKQENIELKYKENLFTIEFASLDFSHGSRDKYAYMLEGFNSDWLYADGSQRRVTYTNLDPGDYTFRVKVLNPDGSWSAEKTLAIDITPPFWRTPIAYTIYFIAALGILLLARKITLDRAHMRFEMRQQRIEAERAHNLDQLKTKFFTNVSHEFRTPLSLIISPLDKVIKNTTDEDQKKQLNLVQRNAKRLLNLVNQLLDFRKIEVQGLKLHPSIGDIIQFAKDTSYSFTDIAEKKGIQFSFSSNVDSLEMYFDKDKIEKILFNLLSNAFKYTHDEGMVSVKLIHMPGADGKEGTISIEVQDSGIGIPADEHEKIFERFFQTDVPETMVNQGTGIGLAITKEFVKLHNGVITVKSEPDKGTCFKVTLPAKKIHEPYIQVPPIAVSLEAAEQDVDASQASRKKKTIVIAEDNEDLRFYLKENLRGQYQVEEAVNGKEAWEKIKLINPDLVVSDIMMPVMDGIELARKIKTDTLTAHIPVVLLTAMGSEEKQIEGFSVGVNDYVTKPFTFEILASRIKNLLAQQKLLQKKFQKQIEVNPGEVTVTPVDEKFLKQALDIVEKFIDDPDFSVEDFSREMCLSRVALYKKILSLTGRAPLEFIRSIRLKRAAQLLEKSGMSVAEIAYEVGFNNPKHFSKYFKEEFKVLPSQYVTAKKEKT